MGVRLRKTVHIKVIVDGRPASRAITLKAARVLRVRTPGERVQITTDKRLELSNALKKVGLSLNEITVESVAGKGRIISVKCSRIASTTQTADSAPSDSATQLVYGAKKKKKKKGNGDSKPDTLPNGEPKRFIPINPGESPLPPMGPRGENEEIDD